MKILAIETSTEACSAALLMDDKLISRFELAPREHTKLILPMMDSLIKEAAISLKEVDAIAFGRGPGAFTGLRIAAGVAQGVALSIDKPVIPVSTLEALALQALEFASDKQKIIAALDARMGEVYWGVYEAEAEVNVALKLIGEEQVSQPQEMLKVTSSEAVIATGIGWDAYQESLFSGGIPDNIHFIENQLPTAEAIAKLALPKLRAKQTVPPEDAQPVYIRNNVAKKSKKV